MGLAYALEPRFPAPARRRRRARARRRSIPRALNAAFERPKPPLGVFLTNPASYRAKRSVTHWVRKRKSLPLRKFAMGERFPGQYRDAETGLHQNWFRDYDPSTGRYVESDPIGLRGGVNTYLYANSNSLNYADPRGLEGIVLGDPDFGGDLPGGDGYFQASLTFHLLDITYNCGGVTTSLAVVPEFGAAVGFCMPINTPPPPNDCDCQVSTSPFITLSSLGFMGKSQGVQITFDGYICYMFGIGIGPPANSWYPIKTPVPDDGIFTGA